MTPGIDITLLIQSQRMITARCYFDDILALQTLDQSCRSAYIIPFKVSTVLTWRGFDVESPFLAF
jgi:hypothetical protein